MGKPRVRYLGLPQEFLTKWKLLEVKSGLYCECSNNYQPSLLGVVWSKSLPCWNWHISAANLVAFCKLLVVIDQRVTYSKSAFTLHPWDIKFTRTTHCLSKKTQAIPLPADEFLRAWWRHVLPLHWSPLVFWHMMMNPCLIAPMFHSYILQTICDKFKHFLQLLQLKFDYCFLLLPKINTHCLLHNTCNDVTAWRHK